MKYFAFALCIFFTLANCMASIWEHNLTLAGAEASAFFGWLSCLFTNLSLDEERKTQ